MSAVDRSTCYEEMDFHGWLSSCGYLFSNWSPRFFSRNLRTRSMVLERNVGVESARFAQPPKCWLGKRRSPTATSGLPRWSQPVDATLYLRGKRWSVGWNEDFIEVLLRQRRRSRWKRGESLKAIGRAFGKESSSIYFLVAPHGGIRPAERRRSRLALTLAEREVISRGVRAHQSARSIAKRLGRSPSTVSREMSRNGGYNRYRATLADENAWARSRRPKCCDLSLPWPPPQVVRGD
jgi:DNA-binding CsgD family transcriptional regulator